MGRKTKKIANKLDELEKLAKSSPEEVSSYVRGYDSGLMVAVESIRYILNENKKD